MREQCVKPEKTLRSQRLCKAKPFFADVRVLERSEKTQQEENMKTVIRNGEYLFVENLMFNDIEVPERPHSDATFENGEWVINLDSYFSTTDSDDASKFLNDSDWKVIRHRDQLALGVETSLTSDEYLALLQERQEARKKVINNVN